MRIMHVIGGVTPNADGQARSVQGLVAAQCAAGIGMRRRRWEK